MRYLRFATTSPERAVGLAGVFTAAYQLQRAGELDELELAWLSELDEWFRTHLKAPSRWELRAERRHSATALFWLKDTAQEHLHRIRALAALLREHGARVTEHVSTRPGYIVYQDTHQVAAVPFGTSRRKGF